MITLPSPQQLRAGKRGAIVLAALAMMFASPVFAQTQQPSAQPPLKAEATPWVKLCQEDEKLKKQVCAVTHELRDGNSGNVMASASIRMVEGEQSKLVVTMPPGLLLQPGIRIQVNKEEQIPGKFVICFPAGCVAQLEATDAIIQGMKKGTELLVLGLGQDQKPTGFKLTLSGFTKAYDGPPTDTKTFQDAQQKLVEEIRKRAAERAQQSGQGQQPAQTPAPPAQ